MYKLFIFTVVGLCSLLVARCDEKFYTEWHEFMTGSFCSPDADDMAKDKYIKCCEMFPPKVTEIIIDVTEKETMREAMQLLCEEKDATEKLCEAMKEKMEELDMDEDAMDNLRQCKNE